MFNTRRIQVVVNDNDMLKMLEILSTIKNKRYIDISVFENGGEESMYVDIWLIDMYLGRKSEQNLIRVLNEFGGLKIKDLPNRYYFRC